MTVREETWRRRSYMMACQRGVRVEEGLNFIPFEYSRDILCKDRIKSESDGIRIFK